MNKQTKNTLKEMKDFFYNFKRNLNLNPVVVSLTCFVVIFLGDLFAIRFLTNTGFVISCLLLVCETVIAVLLSKTTYGILALVAILELILGFIANRIAVILLSLIIYFVTLVVIHVLRKNRGRK